MSFTKQDFDEIARMVKANTATLEGCVGPHKFVRIEERLFSKYRCELCGGVVDGVNAMWYERGLKHAAEGQQNR